MTVRQPVESPTATTTHTVAEALLATFTRSGADVVFLNPGTDTAPFQEAIAAADRGPRLVLCLHESVALAAAHGYFAATGRAQVVMVHVDVGTQNLGSMVHNAARAQVGVVIVAGRTPITAHSELAGGRDTQAHWMQDVPDQVGVVRPYVKWSADIEVPVAVRTMTRAFQVARTGPPGLVYVTAARETLMARTADESVAPVRLPAPAAPDPTCLRRVADLLAGARRPVIVTSRLGRDENAVADLVTVAEATGARVLDGRERVNFPSDHPAYLNDSAAARQALRDADVVLILDSPIPWVPSTGGPHPAAFVIAMEHDPTWPSMPGWSFDVDVAVTCDPAVGVRELAALLGPGSATARSPRQAELPAELVDAADVAAVLNTVLSDEDIVIEEATTNAELLRSTLRRTVPGTYFRSGGSGLGWALGAALGIGLARPDRRLVTIVGDGAFLFGEPIAALWALRRERVATVVIVLRNGGYAACRAPVLGLYPDGAAARTGAVPGTMFDEDMDIAAIGAVLGARAHRPTDPTELASALRQALADQTAGRSSLIEVPVSSPWMTGR
jgi:acetolactate synthase-1/2/3 large subunit